MISFKKGVDCTGIIPLMFNAMVMVHTCYRENGQDNLVITSLRDGKHMKGSKHYQGRAFDVRTRDVEECDVLLHIVEDCRRILGDQFDVVLHKTHMHIEYDPK